MPSFVTSGPVGEVGGVGTGHPRGGTTSLARPPPIVGSHILLHRALTSRITILAICLRPSVACCIPDQARIDRKAFAANQTPDHPRLPAQHLAENVSIAEALVAGARKFRMILILSSIPSLQNHDRPLHLTSTADQPSERIAKTYPTTSIRIISSGSIDGRPIDE